MDKELVVGHVPERAIRDYLARDVVNSAEQFVVLACGVVHDVVSNIARQGIRYGRQKGNRKQQVSDSQGGKAVGQRCGHDVLLCG